MQADILHKYFHRTERWDWLAKGVIHVIDSRAPRLITMDPWPQQIYLDATGERTIGEYINDISSLYPRGTVPKNMEAMVLDEVRALVEREGIVALSDVPVNLEPAVRDPRTPEGPIDMLGRWQGSYAYDGGEGADVDLLMVIDRVKGGRFSGTVTDNEAMGGTPGTGIIQGRIVGDGVTFTKQMPVSVEWNEQGDVVVDAQRKHRLLRYAGEFAPGNRRLSGTWRFKDGWAWKGLLPYRVSYGSGRWTIMKVE